MKRQQRRSDKPGQVRPVFGKRAMPATRATLDLSCIIEPREDEDDRRRRRGHVDEDDDGEEERVVMKKQNNKTKKQTNQQTMTTTTTTTGTRRQSQRRCGGLYLSGGRTVTRDSHLLAEFGITAVLNAADNVGYKSVAGLPECRCHSLPLRDNDANAMLAIRDVIRAIEFIETELQNGCVLVHCRGGINRSAGLVVLYMMKKNAWNWRDAEAYVAERRDINVHMGLQKTLTNIAFAAPSFFDAAALE